MCFGARSLEMGVPVRRRRWGLGPVGDLDICIGCVIAFLAFLISFRILNFFIKSYREPFSGQIR